MSAAELRDLLGAAEQAVIDGWRTGPTEGASSGQSAQTAITDTALDRIAQVGAAFLDDAQTAAFSDVVETLAFLFRAAADETSLGVGGSAATHELVPSRWRDIAARVYSLGALAIVRSNFAAVHPIVLRRRDPVRSSDYWLRETVTRLARAQQFQPQSLIPPIADYVAERDVFYRRFRRNKDVVVNALCQFDFLQCVISVAAADDIHACYPNFGAFYNERTEPIVESLLFGPARIVVQQVSDARLASVVSRLDQLANSEFFRFAGWRANDWSSQRLKSFLAEHQLPQR